VTASHVSDITVTASHNASQVTVTASHSHVTVTASHNGSSEPLSTGPAAKWQGVQGSLVPWLRYIDKNRYEQLTRHTP
jgi:hypothetical protein